MQPYKRVVHVFFSFVGDDAWHYAVGIFLYDARNNAVAPLNALTIELYLLTITLPSAYQNYPSALMFVLAVEAISFSRRARTWLMRAVFSSRVEIIS